MRVKFGQSMIRSVRRAKHVVEVNTQKIRAELLEALKKQFEMAHEFAQNEELSAKQRQLWIRVCGYISQVMNSLAKSFDEAMIVSQLDELERMISEGTREAN